MLETLLRRLDMVRLSVVTSAVVLAVGCSGLIDDGGTDGLTPDEVKARQLFLSKALPTLNAACKTCHDGLRLNIDFMGGASDLARRDQLLSYEPTVVNLDAPGSSRLLTKGQHEGPPLDAIQTSDLLEWIQAERKAAGVGGVTDPGLRTEPVLVQICTSGLPDEPGNPNPNCLVNNVPLDAVGDGATGARISFVVQALSSGLYMTNLKVTPGPSGVLIEHPLFVAFGDDGDSPRSQCELLDRTTGAVACTDTIDRFFNLKKNLETGASIEDQLIGGGAHTFVGFRPTDKISVHFKKVGLFQPDEPPPVDTGGCKKLDPEFKAARAALNAAVGGAGFNCAGCHAGPNANATITMNISQINSNDDAQLLQTCNQVRSRVNLQAIDNSSLYLAVAPNNNNHPVRFTQAQFDQFRNLLNPWITAERDAP
jgi:hypothetical protein